jgi:hypothetical protein
MGIIIPKNFKKKGIYLADWNINKLAWEKKEALEVINYFFHCNDEVGIIGGDVYKLSNNQLVSLYDNWSYDDEANESNKDYNIKSLLEAKKYIENYQINSEDKILFSFVFSDYVVFEDEE